MENNNLNADNNSIQHSTITINAVVLKPPGTLKNEVTEYEKICFPPKMSSSHLHICTHLFSQVERDSVRFKRLWNLRTQCNSPI